MIRITVPVPPEGWLAINDRLHWAARNKRTQAWRALAWARARQSGAHPIGGPVQVTAVIHKATRVRYDLDGCAATVKAAIDGIRDANLIDGDDHSQVTKVTILPGEVRKPACIVLTIETAKEQAS